MMVMDLNLSSYRSKNDHKSKINVVLAYSFLHNYVSLVTCGKAI